ncbi:MAG: Pantothenate synthetase [Alphaproteobacteria bacterium MarineAlpha6_Bin1]|nr:MAG: Pantothenate synthetase [Alphaproteobacteria bacterium MarineAlpha6_Bin1]
MKKLHIIFNVEELKREILQFKLNKKIIGYVPTLGGLHEGHLKLIRFAKKNSDIVIVSIFLNPIQFNSKKDFQSYPKNILQDKKKISLEKVDILYVPSIKQIFPEKKIKKINASRIAKKLCGKFRKGHFDGVVTVLKRLFLQVSPNIAFFGEKDFQQIKVVKDFIKKYKIKIQILTFPTVRDKKGLAFSSRNRLLNKKQKKIAAYLFKIIKDILKKVLIEPKKIDELEKWGKQKLLDYGFNHVDYLEICNENNLSKLSLSKENIRVFVAAKLGKIRLIDNIGRIKNKR